MEIEPYSDKSIVVRIPLVSEIERELQEHNGKYNPNLKGGAGWIFSNSRKDKIHSIVPKFNVKSLSDKDLLNLNKSIQKEIKEREKSDSEIVEIDF